MRARLLTPICLALFWTANGFASTAATEPLGFTRQTLHAGSQTVGLTLTRPVVFAATVAGNDGAMLVLDSGGADIGGIFDSDAHYYVEVTAGAATWLVGDRIDVDVAATRGRGDAGLVLAPASHNTLSLPLPVGMLAGARVSIRRHLTLASVFGADSDAVLRGATSFSAADQVLIFDRVTGSFVSYHLWTNAAGTLVEWRRVGAAGARNDTILPPGCGLFVRRQGAGSVDLVLAGAVRTNDFVMPLARGYNFVASPFPVAGSPYRLQMTSANGFTAAATESDADQILVFNGTDYDTYFLHRAGDGMTEAWKRSASDSEGFTTTELLAASASVFVRKVSADPDFVAARSFSL